MDNKADGEHLEDEEESMLRKTVKYVKTVERVETKKESEETQVEVIEEEVEWRTEGEAHFSEKGGDLDLERVRQGREEEMNYMVRMLGMIRFCSWEEATIKVGKAPTTTKRIDRVKKGDDGREFVICRLVVQDL